MASIHTEETPVAAFQALFHAQYINLTTYRKDGTPVATPVWGSEEHGTIYVETQAETGKIKRIRHESHVVLAPCTARGEATGEAVPAHARIIDERAEELIAEGALQRKYGMKRQFVHIFSSLAAFIHRQAGGPSVYIALVPYNEQDHHKYHSQQ